MQEFTILVVDDDPAIRTMLHELLSAKGNYRVLLAGDSKEAVAAFYSEPRIDVILTDIHMPDHTGLEMVSDMKTVDFKPEILVMTANGNAENVEKSRKIGARSMILKPFDNLDVIEAEISKAIEAAAEKRGEEPPDDVTVATPTEKPAQEPTLEPTQKLTKERPDEDLTARLTRELTEELSDETESTDEPAKEQTGRFTIEPPDEPIDEPTIEPTETFTIDPPDEPSEKRAAKSIEKSAEERSDVPPDELAEDSTEEPSEPPTEESTEPAKDDVIPSVPAPEIDLPERQPVEETAPPSMARTPSGNRHHAPQDTTGPTTDTMHPEKEDPAPAPPTATVATIEEPEVTPEEIALEIPDDLGSIFQLGTDLDTEGLKLQVPIVCLQTLEEQEAIDVLRKLARKLRRRFYTWSATRGIVDTAGKALKKSDAQTGLLGKLRAWVSNTGAGNAHLDPNSALECIAGQTRDSMFILADFGRCLEDPKIARTLREMVMEGRTARTMLVLTAPRISIPAELEGSCEMFDWPDSNEHDIEAVFNQVRKAMEVTVGRPISVDEQAREAILENLKGKSAGRVRFEIARELMKIPS